MMSPNMIYNPIIPFVGPIGGYLAPGHSIRIQGTIHPGAQRFGLNLQCGPNVNPRDDVALHLSPDFSRNCIIRNNILNMNWGPEESHGHFPLMIGQPFDIMIVCEPHGYKIAINGQHYTVFEHRIPYNRVSHFAVDGNIVVTSIEYGGGLVGGSMPLPGGMPMPGAMPMPGYMPMPGAMPTPGYPVSGAMGAQYLGAHPPGHYPQTASPYPSTPQAYPTQYPTQPYSTQNPSLYPTQNPQTYPSANNYPAYKKPSLLEQAGVAVAGTAIGSKLLGKNKGGMMGPMVAGGVAGAALTGHLNPMKMMKKQKKAHKKALKYGIPLAGVGLGAYALHKMGHRSGSSSSSSSSSSSEEEENGPQTPQLQFVGPGNPLISGV